MRLLAIGDARRRRRRSFRGGGATRGHSVASVPADSAAGGRQGQAETLVVGSARESTSARKDPGGDRERGQAQEHLARLCGRAKTRTVARPGNRADQGRASRVRKEEQ